MATPLPLATAVEDAYVEETALWRRAFSPESPGGREITDGEAVAIYAWRSSEVAPHLTVLTTSMHLIGSLARGERGYESPRFIRTCRELWKRGGNVVPFRRRSDDELPPAA